MVTGSLQTKGIFYYIVLNMYPNGKREQKWIPTKLLANNKVNEIKAQKLLADIRVEYNKNSYISSKKTAEELLKERKELNKLIPNKQNSNNLKTSNAVLSNSELTSKEELIITKCLSSWYDMPKQDMINSLVTIIQENPNINLIRKIITELANKPSNAPQE